jgi:hypothetical protein
MIRDILENKTIQNKTVDPTTKKLILQNKFNYADKKEVDKKTEQTNTNIDLSHLSVNEIKDLLKKDK